MTVMPRIRIHLVLQPVLQPIFQTICRPRSLSMQAHDVPNPSTRYSYKASSTANLFPLYHVFISRSFG